MKILFICTGNMHRSPLAAAMLRAEIARDVRADIEVDSAGTIDVEGLRLVAEAACLAQEAGLDVGQHRSRHASAGMIAEADRILVMERDHLDWIASEHPAAAGKSRLLSEYAGPESAIAPGDDVPDAIGEEMASFRRSFDILWDCVRRFYRELPAPPEDVYTQAIEERFRLRRRTPLTLSPADYELACSWWRQGIPLWIVIESIDDLFRKKDSSGDPSRIRRLSWCGRAVEARFAEYQRTHVPGTAGADSAETQIAGTMLAAAAQRLRAAAEAARHRGSAAGEAFLANAADELLAWNPPAPATPAAVRLHLHRLEESVLGELRRLTDPVELAGMREAAASTLSAHRDRMTVTAFEATLERLVSHRLREVFEIPDLASP